MNTGQLDRNLAYNLKRIRKSKNMSLDMLAERTGVSKSMLGQIERGESNPTVTTIGKIVEGMKVSFEELLYLQKEEVVIRREEELPVYKEEKGRYLFKILFPYDKQRKFEVVCGEIEVGAVCECHAEEGHLYEYVTVTRGEMTLTVGEAAYYMHEGAAVRFRPDKSHCYQNTGKDTLRISIVMSFENSII